jgi:hypothetical protein
MIKKEYMKPTMQVEEVQQTQLICVSLTGVKSSGLDSENDLLYDDFDGNGGNQGYAW